MEKGKRIKLFIGSLYLFVLSLFLYFFFSKFSFQEISSYDFLRDNRTYFIELKNSKLFFTLISFFIIIILWVFPFLGFGGPVALVGGFIFGKWVGTIVVLIGITTGSTLLYIFAKFLVRDYIFNKFSQKFSYLTEKFKKNELIYFIIFRAVGGIPFFIQNLLPILFNIKIKNYFIGTFLGMVIQVFIGVSLGAGIDKLIDENENMPSIFDVILMPDIYLPVIGIIGIFVCAFYFRKSFFKHCI